MKTLHLLLIILSACSCLFLKAQSIEPTPIPGQYIVALKESAAKPVALQETAGATREETSTLNQTKRENNLTTLAQVRKAAGISEGNVLAEFADAIVGFSATLTPEEVNKLAARPEVEGVYQDYLIQLEIQSAESTPGEYESGGQTTPCAIVNAGGTLRYTGAGNRWIWILDTGIDLDHPDLSVMDLFPYAKSFIPGETADDKNGHGTHVAGIAAAKDNSFGIVGVSAGAPVVPVKVLSNSGAASLTYVLQGLNHVANYDKANDVVNLSLGAYPITNCETSNPALRNAILNLGASGTWVCIAAGNNAGKAAQSMPGCFNGTRVFTVGGMTCSGDCYASSNWGSTVVDWVATGVNVYSTYKNGAYATLSGTSQATPVVAGIIHALGGAPVSGGTISCGNKLVPVSAYKKARWH